MVKNLNILGLLTPLLDVHSIFLQVVLPSIVPAILQALRKLVANEV